jgi:hypothetical protein
MKKLTLLGIVVGAGLLSLAPVSAQWTPKKLGLYVDKAEAQYYRRHYRRVYRRAYRRAFYGGYGSYYGGYGGYGYPAYSYGYPAYSYGYPYGGVGFGIGIGFGRRGWW